MLPSQYSELGDLVAIDGSLINGVLSMHWADYRTNSKKAKLHFGLDLNRGVPRKLFLTEGNGAERPFVRKIIEPGQTGVLDRGYQAHHLFDQWQADGCHFVCPIKGTLLNTIWHYCGTIGGTPHIFYTETFVDLLEFRLNQVRKPKRPGHPKKKPGSVQIVFQ